jgi:tetratricopeptide (TPR) repeat protein
MFKEAIELKPNNPIYHCDLGGAYVAAPLLAVTRGVDSAFDLSESVQLAIMELEEAIRLKPDYPQAHLILGEAYMYSGKRSRAIEAFRAVLDLSKDRYLRKYAEREMEQVEAGISSQPQPDEARSYLEQAIAYREKGKYNQADKELTKAIKLAPNWSWLYDTIYKLVRQPRHLR